ncbi:MAG: hypothetical protein ACK4ND_03310 [Cytophagaceae bacterium]
MQKDKEEKKNDRIGMAVSLGLHCLLVLFMLLFAAWKEPFPPNPGIPGVEIALGFDAAGSGDSKSSTPAKESPSEQDAKPDKAAPTPAPNPQPEPQQSTPETNPVAEKGENIVSNQAESPHKVKEQSNTSTKPKEDTKVTETKPKTNEESKDSKKDGSDGKVGQDNLMPTSGGKGNTDQKGDQGDPKGKVDARHEYGTPGGGGGGGGPELDIDGWRWDSVPDKKDASNESGKIVFEIIVDSQGYIRSSRMIESTVSPSVVAFYKKQVDDLTFSRTNTAKAPPTTVGRITIIVKSR